LGDVNAEAVAPKIMMEYDNNNYDDDDYDVGDISIVASENQAGHRGRHRFLFIWIIMIN
jgi:hypothetical protein